METTRLCASAIHNIAATQLVLEEFKRYIGPPPHPVQITQTALALAGLVQEQRRLVFAVLRGEQARYDDTFEAVRALACSPEMDAHCDGGLLVAQQMAIEVASLRLALAQEGPPAPSDSENLDAAAKALSKFTLGGGA